jgi:Domain of unknown function (DUF4328)
MQESARVQFRDSSSYALAAMASLGAGALVDAGLLYFLFRHLHDGVPPSGLALKFHLVVRLATACAFLTWFDRLYANAEAIVGSTDYPRWWAIGGFFIPPFLLFRPCEIAAEIWRRTSTGDDAPVIVYVWWAAFLNGAILFILGRAAMSFAMNVIAAGIAIVMVRMLTAREEAAYLVRQREDRKAIQEAKAAAALRAPAPAQTSSAPVAPGTIAPSLAAIEAAAAERAAARRATATWAQGRNARPQPQADSTSTPLPAPEARSQTAPPSSTPLPAVPPLPAGKPLPAVKPLTRPRPTMSTARPHVTHDVIWILFLAIFLGVGGVAMLALAAHIAFDGEVRSPLVAGVYAVAGALLVAFGLLLGRHRTAAGIPSEEWRMVAIAGALVVVANVVVIAGLAG